MKRTFNMWALAALVTVLFTSCIKQIDKNYQGPAVIEFDAAVLNSATTPFSYHVAVRTPPFGLPIATANSVPINRSLATPVRLRVNLVGAQRTTDEVISFRVLTDVTPASPNMLAVAGTHYTITGNTFTIPAGSSFGEIAINIVNPGTASSNPREVHLELVGNDRIKPSENHKRVGIRIAQN
ncbi:MAG TPA: hypothetical protein PKD90_17030 [Phnomibacter sp.]|nr:hypothetical protein [Phnomibacter sp.]